MLPGRYFQAHHYKAVERKESEFMPVQLKLNEYMDVMMQNMIGASPKDFRVTKNQVNKQTLLRFTCC